jgi:hypothetical protein
LFVLLSLLFHKLLKHLDLLLLWSLWGITLSRNQCNIHSPTPSQPRYFNWYCPMRTKVTEYWKMWKDTMCEMQKAERKTLLIFLQVWSLLSHIGYVSVCVEFLSILGNLLKINCAVFVMLMYTKKIVYIWWPHIGMSLFMMIRHFLCKIN